MGLQEELILRKVIDHVQGTWGEGMCPLCGKKSWAVGDAVFELRKHEGGGLRVGNVPVIPVVPVTCNVCGNTVLINALKCGALAADGEEGK